MDIPEGVHLEIFDPDGVVIGEVDLEGYDPDSSTEAGMVGGTVMEAVGRWMERGDR